MRDAKSNAASAKSAGLRYVSDESGPGITRQRHGKAFIYFSSAGRRIHETATLARIRSLAIPPAWTDVWICPNPDGHIKGTGRDAAGRKQHRYHPKWRESRDGAKYDHVISFAKTLPKIRRRTSADLRRPGLPREKVLALSIKLLEKTLIRVGNEEYAHDHHHFGLTTLRDRHVRIHGSDAIFDFTGKSGVHRQFKLHDSHLAHLIKSCQDLPGQHLFRYKDNRGKPHNITSTDVNNYLHDIGGNGFTAKDFRTWAGTVLAARALQKLHCGTGSGNSARSEQGRAVPLKKLQNLQKKNIVKAIESVAQQLGNTPAICRKCYVHPAILNAYFDGSLIRTLQQRSTTLKRTGLSQERAAVLHLLSHAALSSADGKHS